IFILLFLFTSNITHSMLIIRRACHQNNTIKPYINKKSKERLLLRYAKQLNKEKIKNLLDKKDVDINYQDEETGCTALLFTTLQPFLKEVHPIDTYDMLEQVEILINSGANKDIQDNKGNTALDYITRAKDDVFKKRDDIR